MFDENTAGEASVLPHHPQLGQLDRLVVDAGSGFEACEQRVIRLGHRSEPPNRVSWNSGISPVASATSGGLFFGPPVGGVSSTSSKGPGSIGGAFSGADRELLDP